jgi:hypothetical protein
MDSKIWISLIIAVIYLVVRALKKSDRQPGDTGDVKPDREVRYNPTPPVDKPRQLTFEELLKEITEGKQTARPSLEPVRPQQTTVVDYDDNLGEEEQDLEEIEVDYRKKDRLYSDYEEAKRQAFERPSLEETMNVKDTDMRFGKFKEFETNKEQNLLAQYLREFRDPEGFKKAVVMSEILNRKF